MAELEVLEVKVRNTFGKRRVRRLRETGLIPANLYGHKQDPVNLVIDAATFNMILRHGHQIVKFTGDCIDEALIKEVQWNVWGNKVLHVDFARIDANEKITVTVPFVLKGDAIGLREGGVVEQLIHEAEVECSALNIPDALFVNVSELGLNQHITVADITMPEGVTCDLAADAVIVSCVVKKEEVEEAAAPAEGEPEVIARKKAEEEPEA